MGDSHAFEMLRHVGQGSWQQRLEHPLIRSVDGTVRVTRAYLGCVYFALSLRDCGIGSGNRDYTVVVAGIGVGRLVYTSGCPLTSGSGRHVGMHSCIGSQLFTQREGGQWNRQTHYCTCERRGAHGGFSPSIYRRVAPLAGGSEATRHPKIIYASSPY
jgi:hypothetical protein